MNQSICSIQQQIEQQSLEIKQLSAFRDQTYQSEYNQVNQPTNDETQFHQSYSQNTRDYQIQPYQTIPIVNNQSHKLLSILESKYRSLPDSLQQKINFGNIKLQTQQISEEEAKLLWEYRDCEAFWINIALYMYIPLAIYMASMIINQQKPRTISNNRLVVRRLSEIAQKEGLTVLTPSNFVLYYKILRGANIQKLSTMKLHLKILKQILTQVFKSNLRLPLKIKGEPTQKKSQILLSEFKQIVSDYHNSDKIKDKLFGFALHLLYNTGERNSSIRTLPFNYFSELGQQMYGVQVDSSKTDSSQKYLITQNEYQFVASIKKIRDSNFKNKQLKLQQIQKQIRKINTKMSAVLNSNEIVDQDNTQIQKQISHQDKQLKNELDNSLIKARAAYNSAKRRRKYLFPFFTGSAFNQRFTEMKKKYKQVQDIEGFVIHSIRGMRLQQAYQQGDINNAVVLARHKNQSTTIKHYLDLSLLNLPFGIGNFDRQ